MQNDYTIPII